MSNAKRDRLAREFLSQFCISPGTPHWLAGERDFKAGYDSRQPEIDRLRKALEFYAGFWGKHHGFSDATNELIQRILNEKGKTAREALEGAE